MSATAAAAKASGGRGLWVSHEVLGQTLSHMTGPRTARSPRSSLSPSRVLAFRLRSKTNPQKQRYGPIVVRALQQRSQRLPLLTLQAVLQKQLRDGEKDVYTDRAVEPANSEEWKNRLHSLKARGLTEKDINHWAWIASGENGDNRVERFVGSHVQQPTFLLLLILRSDERFRDPKSFLKLMDYFRRKLARDRLLDRSGQQKRPTYEFTVAQILIFLRRLIVHVQRLWPMSIVTVARFVADIIRGLGNDNERTYQHRCKIFNTALWLFKRPASTHPVRNMEFNWRAQKILLAMSDDFEKPLVINKASYRAMRQVMVGLRRSASESQVAYRYSHSWPPYRQDFDGHDARRTPEDDQSRSYKAGILMQSAGYDKGDYDRALDVLGGISTDSPTIQTRSLAPRLWRGEKEKNNRHSYAAMRVRATRNAHEAWAAFRSCHDPNIQVYAEMFHKLMSPLAPQEEEQLPGNSREAFPMHDANYSEFELARQMPPTLPQLYQQMLERGVKPEGSILDKLISEAPSIEKAIQYMKDGDVPESEVQILKSQDQVLPNQLRRIPLRRFTSYIKLLCKLQPRQDKRKSFAQSELFRINTAIMLARTRLTANTTEGLTYRMPWYAICSTLAAENLRLFRHDPNTSYDNEALAMQIDVLQHVDATVGIDPQLFLHYCQTVQKAAVFELRRLRKYAEARSGSSGLTYPAEILSARQNTLNVSRAMFRELTKPIAFDEKETSGFDAPEFLHIVGPAQLHTYMRTLGFLEAADDMAALLVWMLDHEKLVADECERVGKRGYALISRTLCAFEAFAGPLLTPEQHQTLEERIEATNGWHWPTAEEVEAYVQADHRGTSGMLQERVLRRSRQLMSDENVEDENTKEESVKEEVTSTEKTFSA